MWDLSELDTSALLMRYRFKGTPAQILINSGGGTVGPITMWNKETLQLDKLYLHFMLLLSK